MSDVDEGTGISEASPGEQGPGISDQVRAPPGAEVETISPMFEVMRRARTMDGLVAALRDSIKIDYTWSDDVWNYVSLLLGSVLNYTIHEGYIAFIHPLTKMLVKLPTHKNSVRSAPARMRNATAELTKIEEEIDALNTRRIAQLIEMVTLDIEMRVYADYTGEEEKVAEQQSNIKIDKQQERRKWRKREKKALKRMERELQQKAGTKRRLLESSDDSSDEETEEDRSFLAPEGRPRKHPRAAASDEITVHVKLLNGEERPFDAQLHSPARALRMHIAECLEGVQSDQIRLIHRGRPLNDDLTLHQNEVAEGARIHLVMANTGGGIEDGVNANSERRSLVDIGAENEREYRDYVVSTIAEQRVEIQAMSAAIAEQRVRIQAIEADLADRVEQLEELDRTAPDRRAIRTFERATEGRDRGASALEYIGNAPEDDVLLRWLHRVLADCIDMSGLSYDHLPDVTGFRFWSTSSLDAIRVSMRQVSSDLADWLELAPIEPPRPQPQVVEIVRIQPEEERPAPEENPLAPRRRRRPPQVDATDLRQVQEEEERERIRMFEVHRSSEVVERPADAVRYSARVISNDELARWIHRFGQFIYNLEWCVGFGSADSFVFWSSARGHEIWESMNLGSGRMADSLNRDPVP